MSQLLTWGQFKEFLAEAGVDDADIIGWINIEAQKTFEVTRNRTDHAVQIGPSPRLASRL